MLLSTRSRRHGQASIPSTPETTTDRRLFGLPIHTDVDGGRVTAWYIDGDRISAAADVLQLDRLMPTHWDVWRGVGAAPKSLHDQVASCQYQSVLEVGRLGDRVDVARPGVVRLRALQTHW